MKKGLPKSVNDGRFMTTNLISTKIKIHLQPMNVKGGFVYHLIILKANTHANVIFEPSLHTNESHIGINESILTIIKQIWTQINEYFL